MIDRAPALASTAGRPEDAERWHRSGLELARHLDSPLWIAHCLYDYAVHLLASDRSGARRMLAEAAAICDEHGLAGLGHRVERLRAFPSDGVSTRPRAFIPVALAADEPLVFGTGLAGQYDLAREVLGFPDGELAELARHSIRAGRRPRMT